MKRVAAVLCVVAVACASAGQGSGGGGNDHPDAKKQSDAPDQQQDPDAPMPDAAPAGPDAAISATLSQTNDGTSVGSASSVTCGSTSGTSENSWYRAFRLADHGISGGFHITGVTVGVQEAAGSPTVQIKIGTYAGTLNPAPTTLNTAQITPLTSANLTIPNTVATAPTTATVPISANIPAGGQFVVEVFLPDLSNTGNYYYLGGNGGGETKPGYIRAPATGCAISVPTTVASIGFPTSALLISVTGTH